MVKPVRDLVYTVWQEELKNDSDKEFLLHGIKNGFDIVQDINLAPLNISAKNHPSAHISSPLYDKAHQQILIEIENGNYELATSTPKIISPLGVISKPDGGVRIIHDCSRPIGSAVNDFAGDMDKQKFQSVDDAAKLVTKNCFMSKVDLKSAYRSVGISRSSQQLGFAISWSKVLDPCQKLVFLGVEIDSTTFELRLPSTKLEQLRQDLVDFQQRKHVSKKQLQSLAGKLNWASSVVRGGRVFLRRIIDGITKLKHDWHKMRLCGDILHDIHWWYNFMTTFNGKSFLLNTDPVTSVYTDACKTGAGGVFGTDWFYVNWKEDFPFAQTLHINEQEAFAVALAAKRWAKCWQNKRVYIYCDNSSTVGCINNCTSKNKLLMSFLRELFWLSATNNFQLVAIHLPGKQNDMADAVSRLHELKLLTNENYCNEIQTLELMVNNTKCGYYLNVMASYPSCLNAKMFLDCMTGILPSCDEYRLAQIMVTSVIKNRIPQTFNPMACFGVSGPSKFVAEVKINATWDEDLSSAESSEYRQLKATFEQQAWMLFSNQVLFLKDHIESIDVLSFKPGSVIVEFAIIIKSNSDFYKTLQLEDIRQELVRAIKELKMNPPTAPNYFTSVDVDSINITGSDDGRQDVTTPTPTTLAPDCHSMTYISSIINNQCDSAKSQLILVHKDRKCSVLLDMIGCLLFHTRICNKEQIVSTMSRDFWHMIGQNISSEFDPFSCFGPGNEVILPTIVPLNVTLMPCVHPDVVHYILNYDCYYYGLQEQMQGDSKLDSCRFYWYSSACLYGTLQTNKDLLGQCSLEEVNGVLMKYEDELFKVSPDNVTMSECLGECYLLDSPDNVTMSECLGECYLLDSPDNVTMSECLGECYLLDSPDNVTMSECLGECYLLDSPDNVTMSECLGECYLLDSPDNVTMSECLGECYLLYSPDNVAMSECLGECYLLDSPDNVAMSECLGECYLLDSPDNVAMSEYLGEFYLLDSPDNVTMSECLDSPDNVTMSECLGECYLLDSPDNVTMSECLGECFLLDSRNNVTMSECLDLYKSADKCTNAMYSDDVFTIVQTCYGTAVSNRIAANNSIIDLSDYPCLVYQEMSECLYRTIKEYQLCLDNETEVMEDHIIWQTNGLNDIMTIAMGNPLDERKTVETCIGNVTKTPDFGQDLCDDGAGLIMSETMCILYIGNPVCKFYWYSSACLYGTLQTNKDLLGQCSLEEVNGVLMKYEDELFKVSPDNVTMSECLGECYLLDSPDNVTMSECLGECYLLDSPDNVTMSECLGECYLLDSPDNVTISECLGECYLLDSPDNVTISECLGECYLLDSPDDVTMSECLGECYLLGSPDDVTMSECLGECYLLDSPDNVTMSECLGECYLLDSPDNVTMSE
ncbi:unnamed protein product [Mytilus coruscus]|uniref:SEA domain-containing protein n=1 Tax=Mytilus coruscus TaxID=42192 RepID=A0A6J8F1G2_MYTCO|nr:unnamed protein product [Mytilus coruscus]